MSKLLIIATIFCFTSLSVHGQDVVKTNQTDSLDIIGLYENLPEIMVVGERPIVKLEDEGVSKCTPSFFYAQSPDFHKLGLCYYLKILYL